jgi:addiction module RelE/StbE family toxin
MWSVFLTKSADKELKKCPQDIRDSFDAWKNVVEQSGPNGLKSINGYWDHALKGEWEGARASSLNKQWRVIYTIEAQEIRVIVLNVTPHDYRRKR